MKNLTKRNLILAVLAVFFVVAGASQSWAYDRYPDGYWDRNGHWQSYGYYHHHRGYWDDRPGGRIWINIG